MAWRTDIDHAFGKLRKFIQLRHGLLVATAEGHKETARPPHTAFRKTEPPEGAHCLSPADLQAELDKLEDKKKLVELLGYRFPKDSPVMKHLEGAKEIDIVNSALEEIMVTSTEEHWAYAKKKNYTLREACLGNSLQKLASRFEESGMLM